MLKSFSYMFKDNNFWKKYLSVFGFILIANFLINYSGTFSPELNGGEISPWYYILFFAGFIFMFVPYGYSISALKITLEGNEAGELPYVNIVKNFMAGLKVVLAGLVLVIPLLFVVYLLVMLNIILSKFLGGILSVMINVVLCFIFFWVLFSGIAMCCRYVKTPSYLNFVNFKAAAQLINCDVARYFKVFWLTILCTVIVYSITFLLVSVLTKIGYAGLVIYCILISLLWTYQIYLFAGLFSNAVIAEKV